MLFLLLAASVAAGASTPNASAPSVARLTAVPAVGGGAPPMKQDLAGDPDAVICRRIVTTGTRFATKDCRTRAEWNQLSVDSRQATLDMTSRQNGFSN